MSPELVSRIAQLTGRDVRSAQVIGGQHGYQHLEVVFADGTPAFGKTSEASAGGGGFMAEANGLRWLAAAGAVPVPDVLGADETTLIISIVPPDGAASPETAYRFGGD